MRHRPAPTNDEIADAIDAAMTGRGRPLARLLKSFSLDDLARGDIDKRWLAIGRTAIEQGFMAVNRAVFQPERVTDL